MPTNVASWPSCASIHFHRDAPRCPKFFTRVRGGKKRKRERKRERREEIRREEEERVIFVLSSRTFRFNRVSLRSYSRARCRTSCTYFLPFVALLINLPRRRGNTGKFEKRHAFRRDRQPPPPWGGRAEEAANHGERSQRAQQPAHPSTFLSFFLSFFSLFSLKLKNRVRPRGVSRVTRDKTRVSTSKARPLPFLRHVTGKL